jgi:hypothetical protein
MDCRITNYRMDKTKNGLYILHRRRGWKDSFTGTAFSITGPGEPDIPDRPLTRQEVYALLSGLTARGYQDNLLP